MKFRLLHYRTNKELTQGQVALAIGISQGLYNQLESGKRRMNETYLDQLALFYKVSPIDLIVDAERDDPLHRQLSESFRQLNSSERLMLVNSAKGLVAAHVARAE